MNQVLFIYVIAMNFGVQDVLGLEEIFRSNLRKKGILNYPLGMWSP